MILRRVDLNLFRVFEAVMHHRSVNGAAKELNLTSSAISHALARLRRVLDDELFVVGSAGMQPTPRALELAPSISGGMDNFLTTLSEEHFDPARSVRTFTLAATDYAASVLIPPLMRFLSKNAPQISIRVFPANQFDALKFLDERRVDLLVGWFANIPTRLRRTRLTVEYGDLVVRAGHPILGSPITIERLFDFPHVVVELTGSGEQGVAGFLNDQGMARRTWFDRVVIESVADNGLVAHVPLTVPHYSVVPHILAETDMIATMPRRMVAEAIRVGSLVRLDIDYKTIEVSIEAVSHRRSASSSSNKWLLSTLEEVCKNSDVVS